MDSNLCFTLVKPKVCTVSGQVSSASLHFIVASKDAETLVAMLYCVLLQKVLTKCQKSGEAGEAVISRRDAATRGIAAALQVGSVCRP